ncbi:MAG: hypothetical protein ACRDD7_08320 [Peptostreptococcaceae bacterium]
MSKLDRMERELKKLKSKMYDSKFILKASDGLYLVKAYKDTPITITPLESIVEGMSIEVIDVPMSNCIISWHLNMKEPYIVYWDDIDFDKMDKEH